MPCTIPEFSGTVFTNLATKPAALDCADRFAAQEVPEEKEVVAGF